MCSYIQLAHTHNLYLYLLRIHIFTDLPPSELAEAEKSCYPVIVGGVRPSARTHTLHTYLLPEVFKDDVGDPSHQPSIAAQQKPAVTPPRAKHSIMQGMLQPKYQAEPGM